MRPLADNWTERRPAAEAAAAVSGEHGAAMQRHDPTLNGKAALMRCN